MGLNELATIFIIFAVIGAIVVVDYLKEPHYKAGYSGIKFVNNLCQAPSYCNVTHPYLSDSNCTVVVDC